MKLVSVIVPVYNVKDYLDKCIKSIINQTYSEIEIILVDDGSTDGSEEICDSWKEKDDRVIVIHKTNGGLSEARNFGMNEAKGSYICFIDSDDWIDLDWIEILVKAIENNDADIATSATKIVGVKNETMYVRGNLDTVIESKEALIELIEEKNIFNTVCDKMYRRELACTQQFELGKTNEDEFWTWRIIQKSNKLVCVNNTNYNYYQRENSIMGNAYSIKRLDGLQARYERNIALANFDGVGDICNVKFVGDCMYHLQMILKCLRFEDKKKAKKTVKNYIGRFKCKDIIKCNVAGTHSIWLVLFLLFPISICKIRNKLRIGH